jgi:hypothetical protein
MPRITRTAGTQAPDSNWLDDAPVTEVVFPPASYPYAVAVVPAGPDDCWEVTACGCALPAAG